MVMDGERTAKRVASEHGIERSGAVGGVCRMVIEAERREPGGSSLPLPGLVSKCGLPLPFGLVA